MKIIYSILLILGITHMGLAQNNHKGFCASKSPEEQIRANTKLNEEQKKLLLIGYEKQLALIKNSADKRFLRSEKSDFKYIIPVVFHILHNNGPENISEAQVRDQLRLMNEEFQKLNSKVNGVIPEFRDRIADVQIEYRLATIDPNGNCTNGIVRYQEPGTNFKSSDDIDDIKPEYFWPREHYLNCLVVGTIESSGGGRVLGFAQFPYSFPGFESDPLTDGIVMVHDGIGSIGTSADRTSSVTTHEIGHWLGLFHTWGNCAAAGSTAACNCDDEVTDTPNTRGNPSTCGLGANTCGAGTTGDEIDNVQNFMDYSFCFAMFTEGQKARMHAVLNDVPFRRSLWQEENLLRTGTLSAQAPINICKVDFEYAKRNDYCSGSTINFNDISFHDVRKRKWTFEGGNPLISTEKSPNVTYSQPGEYSVTLYVESGVDSRILTQTKIIKILPNDFLGNTLEEDFEGYSFESNMDFDAYDLGEDGVNFTINNQYGSSGTSSVMLANFSGNDLSEFDELISKTIDLSGYSRPQITFKYAFAAKGNNNTDELNVFASANCGETWSKRTGITGSALRTGGIQNNAYFPAAMTEWKQATVSISTFKTKGFRLRFQFKNGGGNNLFIDDINLSDIVGIGENEVATIPMELYPNPSNKDATLKFTLNNNSDVELKLTDLTGRTVATYYSGKLSSGEQEMNLTRNELKSGIYFVVLKSNNTISTKKLIFN